MVLLRWVSYKGLGAGSAAEQLLALGTDASLRISIINFPDVYDLSM